MSCAPQCHYDRLSCIPGLSRNVKDEIRLELAAKKINGRFCRERFFRLFNCLELQLGKTVKTVPGSSRSVATALKCGVNENGMRVERGVGMGNRKRVGGLGVRVSLLRP